MAELKDELKKSVYENKKLKLEKLFIVLQMKNYFTEIKEGFSGQLKMFSIWSRYFVGPNTE